MSVRDKAGILLCKLNSMWRRDLEFVTFDDLLDLASEKEIEFYYNHICVGR